MGLLSVFALNDLLRAAVSSRKIGIEMYPLLLSAYFVIILTQNLVARYRLEFTSVAISVIYVVAAFLCIIFGFMKKFAYLRRFGLGLAVVSVIKLFLVDLSFSSGNKIFSYFALGFTLIAISFVYQYFSKRLEAKFDE
jgi:uncharacterized membrane protein